ncbi:MAG TPA: tRNA (N6-isopentenyl adenosine(37)-C2)-methylthiotransferase MiaB [bacterium]|nr:tRNA (N6-isopentenyl adenosine(37)-C2)-methylthiotransferase MiaB [bacterium]
MKGRVYIRTFGCQMNVKDSERMMGLLAAHGYGPAAGPDDADVLLCNTCSVREKPEQKIMGVLGRWKALKQNRPTLVTAVCGCVAQQKGQEFLDRLPWLSLVVGTQMVHRLPELVERARSGERLAAVQWLERGDPDLFAVPEMGQGTAVKGFVSIMQGCDNRCAYCIVPFVRGPAVSRRADDVLREVKEMAARGVKEVTLLGQNVNAYHDRGIGFPELLRLAAKAGVERVRFTTSHPKDLDDGLIEVMADDPRVMEAIHLPAQAGSDRVLRAMNRGYTRDGYLDLIRKLRAAMPEVGITADLIVGFPGESEHDFQDTLRLLEEVRYDETFSFRYSPRPGTAAAGFAGQVPEPEKYQRLYRLQELQEGITQEKNQEQVSGSYEVLIEGPSKNDPGKLSGRTRSNRIVHIARDGVRPGDLVKVRVTRALKHSLEGEPCAPTAALTGAFKEETCFWR